MPSLCEPVAALSHLIGGLLALLLAPFLVRAGRGCGRRQALLAAFAAVAAFQLLISGLYHSFPHGSAPRAVLQRVDHAAIWLVVAGSFLPVRWFLLSGRLGRVLEVSVTGCAVAGLLVETAFHAVIPSWVVVLIYVAFGSVGTPIAVWLVATRGLRFTLPFFVCGVSFSLGALVELAEEPNLAPGVFGYHELVHFLVLAGLLLHGLFLHRLTVLAVARGEVDAAENSFPKAGESEPELRRKAHPHAEA